MGPRFNGVEDKQLECQSNPSHSLQWGHALMAWKTTKGAAARSAEDALQWGHALMAWKTRGDPRIVRVDSRASMGPRFNGVEDSG